MSQQNDIRIVTGATVDKQSVKQAQDSFKSLAKEAESSADKIGDTGGTVEKLSKELAKLERQKTLDKIAREAAKLAAETGDAEEATKQLARELDKVGASDKEVEGLVRNFNKFVDAEEAAIDRAKKLQSELAQVANEAESVRLEANAERGGDNASLAATARGGLDALSGGNLGGAGQALEAVEAFGDLQEVLGKVSAQAAKGGGSLASLAGAIPGIGIAIAAVVAGIAAAVAILQKQSEGLRDSYDDAVNAQRSINAELATLTTEEINLRVEANDIQLEAQRELLGQLEANWKAAQDRLGVLANLFAGNVNEQFKEQQELVEDLEAETRALNEARSNEAVANNDAKQAELERSASIIEQAAAQAELTALSREAVDLTSEERSARQAQLRERRQQIQDEINTLKQSGNNSEQVQQRIQQLNGELRNVDAQIKTLSSTAQQAAQATQAFSQAVSRFQSEAANRAAVGRESRLQRGRVGSSRSSSSSGISRSGGGLRVNVSGGVSGASAGLSNEAIRASNEFAQSANAAGQSLGDSIRDINRGLKEGIQDLAIQQRRDIGEARRTGNILAIRNIAREAGFAAEDINRQANRDRLRAQEDYNSEVLRLERQKNQALLQEAQNFASQFQSTVRGAFNNFQSGGSRSGGGNGITVLSRMTRTG